MNGKQHYYWDTCVFIAYLLREEHRNGEAEEIANQVKLFEMGAVYLYTSAITITELFASVRLDVMQSEKLKEVMRRSNFGLIDANESVCFRASKIREHFKNNPIKEKSKREKTVVENNKEVIKTEEFELDLYPSTPDAIHIASAVAIKELKGVEIDLITFDSNTKESRDGKHKELALTKCSTYIESTLGVRICRPEVPKIFQASYDASKEAV